MAKQIKTIKRYNQHYKTFRFTDGQPEAEEEFLESVIEMDASGNVLMESKFDSSGELEEKNSYSYESHGKVTEHILLFAMEDMTEKRLFRRDDKGRLLEEIKYYGDDSGERTTFVYDEKDQLIERKYYDEEGEFQYVENFIYDEKGSLVEHGKVNNEGKSEGRHAFAHNHGDHTILENEFGTDGSLASKTLYTVDDAGRELSAVQTTAEGKLISSVITTYDEKGNPLERQFKDFYSKTVKYTYDENNHVLTNELFDTNGMLIKKNMYEYDADGNLSAEQVYEMDSTRGGRDKHFGSRYEFEFFES
ncbi:MAG: hypothetical protein NT126_00765 [Bacteroidetes bacterium]|nr:hypothetical protein [Bacteroidota bacterium]